MHVKICPEKFQQKRKKNAIFNFHTMTWCPLKILHWKHSEMEKHILQTWYILHF